MKAPVILRIFKDTQLIEVKQFDVNQIVVGHDADVQLDLKGDGVSSIHCLIELRDNGYYVCDLGSQTGTFKNGQAVLDESLSSGDEIRVGSYRIVFYVGAPKPTAAPNTSGTDSVIPDKPSAPVPKSPIPSAATPAPAGKTIVSGENATATVKPDAGKPVKVPVERAPEEPTRQNVPQQPVKGGPRPAPGVQIQGQKPKPEIRAKGDIRQRVKVSQTFAPPSEIKDLKSTLIPGKGNVVEVVVAWRERIIESFHFSDNGQYKVGAGKNDAVRLATDKIPKNWTLVEINNGARVNVSDSMTFELVSTSQGNKKLDDVIASGKGTRNAAAVSVRLDQNEMICLNIGEMNLYIRYVPRTAVVPLLPALGLTGSELSGLIMAVVLTALLAFYISATTPKDLADVPQEQITRTAQVIFNTPPSPPPAVEQPPVTTPPPPTTNPPKKIEVTEHSQDAKTKGKNPSKVAAKASTAGLAAEVAPNKNKNAPKKFTSVHQGGAVKTTDKSAASAQSAKPKDLTKVGLFSAFGGGGVRKQLDQAYSGAGEVLGQADRATGNTGMNENRAGDDIGSKFKDTGAGGKGTATQGIAGVGTKGRGSGQSAYGSVDGMGGKTSVAIDAGGNDADFVGTIDKEAVRRVVKHNLAEIRGCYVRELNKIEKGQKLEGKVVVSWEIVAQGQVRNVRIKSSTLGNSTVENCIRERLASWIFPNPPTGTVAEVAYPFLLSQGQ